jgi:hypothetical protein
MAGNGRQNADPLLIAALLNGATLADAARSSGLGERTVGRRLSDPGFRERLDRAENELIDATARALANSTAKAAAKLEVLLDEGSAAVQLGASRTILDSAQKWRPPRTLEKRIAALEQDLAERKKKQG